MKTAKPIRTTTVLVLAAACLVAAGHASRACSTFCMGDGDHLLFAKNYDWDVPDGVILVNPAGAAKRASVDENPARWTSRFGSVTFNQYGREQPCGGMNEAGLVVELMWLDETNYPAADDRSAVSLLQWIQYQLDNAATVGEVIASDAHIRIRGAHGLVHFLVADADGDAATIEFIDGELVAHSGASLPYPVLTNSTYAASLDFLRAHEGFGGGRAIPRSSGSLERFVRAADRAGRYDASRDGDPVAYAFATLDDVAQPHTQWSIVYDIGARRVYVRTSDQRAVRYLDLAAVDFSCERPAQYVDLHAPLEGDLAPHLGAFSTETNTALMRASFAKTRFLSGIPDDAVREAARYPETITCRSHAR